MGLPTLSTLGGLDSRSAVLLSVLWHLNLFSIAKTKYPRLEASQRKDVCLVYASGGRKFKIEWPHPLAARGFMKDITMVRVHAEEIAWADRRMFG